MDIISGVVGLIGSIFGGSKKKKANAQALQVLNQKVGVLQQENVEQSKMIKYLLIGFAVLAAVVFFFVFLKKRRGK